MSQHTVPDIGPATPTDLDRVHALVAAAGLPTEGIPALAHTLLVARVDDLIVGCAALEVYGAAGLLRSVAVDAGYRGRGIGVALTKAALALAARHALERVYLLTETAETFFPRFGFRPVPRESVDSSVRGSEEFRSLCPDTAVAMVLHVKSGAG